MKPIRFAVCGAGLRGKSLALDTICNLPDTVIPAVCDLYEDKAVELADKLAEAGFPRPNVYTDHMEMLKTEKPDAVYVATSWETHIEVAMDAMRLGVAAAMEVGGAYNEEQCRALVSCYEETKTPIMMMENCCYDKHELLATSLVRNGKFGEVVYCHGAYAHDLRYEVSHGDIIRHYRLRNYTNRNCENYPTHELGPIAKLLNITRGNRMVSLVSLTSKARGLHDYIVRSEDEKIKYLTDREFKQGDITETLIRCENGELISLKLDTTLPRAYSREFTVRGTRGMFAHDGNMVLLDGKFTENWSDEDMAARNYGNSKDYAAYLPEIWANVSEETKKHGHGGMDWFEFVAFVDCLREGKPMPIDVYDAVTWMSISYLTEQSIANGGAPVEIPDFTHGLWKTRKPEDVVPIPVVND